MLPNDVESLIHTIQLSRLSCHSLAEKLDKLLTNASQYAELQCQTKKRSLLPKSLVTLMDKYNFYRKCMSELKTGKQIIPSGTAEVVNQNKSPSSIEECNSILRSLKKEIREEEKSIQQSLEEEMDSSIEECMLSGDKQKEKELRNLRKARELNAVFSKLNKIRRNSTNSSFNSIDIPTDLPDKPKEAKQWTTIDAPEEITKYLIQRNRQHFGQAEGTPFTVPPLSVDLDYKAAQASAELMLEGDYNHDELDDLTKKFVKHMQRVTLLDSVKKLVTTEEFIDKVKTWKESTSTSPSGLHLGHYHAMVQRHDLQEDHPQYLELERKRMLLIRAHVALINYAVRFGYSYKRWKKIVNVMILKDPGDTRIHRLRVIHMYEADYNMINGVFWRRAVHHAEAPRTTRRTPRKIVS